MMKKFTLVTVMLLLTLIVSAQRHNVRMPSLMNMHAVKAEATLPVKDIKGKSLETRKDDTRQRVQRKAEDNVMVTLPEGVEAETWAVQGGALYSYTDDGWADYTQYRPELQVAFNGTDVYIQGLALYFEDAWVKGTMDKEGVITFKSGQLVGSDSYGDEYINGQDANDENPTAPIDYVFTYDADAETLTLSSDNIIIEAEGAETLSCYAYWYGLVLHRGAAELPEEVVVPEDLVTKDYVLTATELVQEENEDDPEAEPAIKETPVSWQVQVGFYGDSEVYVKGLSQDLPNSWVKGERNGNTVTFAKGQYLGTLEGLYSSYTFYFMGVDNEGEPADVVFTINEQTQTLNTNTILLTASPTSTDAYYVFTSVAMTPLTVVPAMPAAPQFGTVSMTGDYPYAEVYIPAEDTDGNTLAGSHLFYQLYKDIEGDVKPYVLSAADYQNIEEDMTLVPYLFSDNWDIESGTPITVYLYGTDLRQWNRIGVKSVYDVDGKVNETEIVWYEIKPYAGDVEGTEYTFDFNAMPSDSPVSTSSDHSGDITQNLDITEGNVTLTVSPSGANTPNRWWKDYNSQLIQLRVYGGTLTFAANNEDNIVKIDFYYAKFDEGNTADSGDIYDDGTVATWTGSASQVVFTIAKNTQLNKIVVTTAGETNGIESVVGAKPQNEVFYTIDGRKLNGVPTRSGIYLLGGKKVVVK